MNGRTLSRAIQSRSPMTMVAAMRTTTRGERGTKRDAAGPAAGAMNGGGGSEAAQRASWFAGRSTGGGAGASMVPQTTRRGTAPRDGPSAARRGTDRRRPGCPAPTLAARPGALRHGARTPGTRSDRHQPLGCHRDLVLKALFTPRQPEFVPTDPPQIRRWPRPANAADTRVPVAHTPVASSDVPTLAPRPVRSRWYSAVVIAA